MSPVNLVIFFLSGLIIGSFLNVVILRIDNLKSIIKGRSQCRNCKEVLSWLDLIPLVSYISLKGRCRYCGDNISWQYPLVEGGTGLLFAGLYYFYGLTPALFFYLIIFCLLIIIAVYDILTQYVPEFFVWLTLILLLMAGWFYGNFSFGQSILGALIVGGVLFLLVAVSKEKWMGSGDIKIGMILGLIVGYPRALFGLFASFILGSIVGLIYIYLTKKTLKASLPFAPFLILSALIALLWGDKVINWYLGKLIF